MERDESDDTDIPVSDTVQEVSERSNSASSNGTIASTAILNTSTEMRPEAIEILDSDTTDTENELPNHNLEVQGNSQARSVTVSQSRNIAVEASSITRPDSALQTLEIATEVNSDVSSVPIPQLMNDTEQIVSTEDRSAKRERSAEPVELECNKKKHTGSSSDEDEGKLCPICFDDWTTSGQHRVCCLKCGHLFGHSCLKRWLKSQPGHNKSCPSCKRKVKWPDIRFLYVKRVVAVDTTEIEQLRTQLREANDEKDKLRVELAREGERIRQCETKFLVQMQQLEYILNAQKGKSNTIPNVDDNTQCTLRYHKEHCIEIDPRSGCRVFDYCPQTELLAVSGSTQSTSPFFANGFCVRKISMMDYRVTGISSAHFKSIRDIAFHERRLLSVALDSRAVVADIRNNHDFISMSCQSPLWSCCWDQADENKIFVGEARGYVTVWDVRQTRIPVTRLEVEGDGSPVVSVASANGRLLCCKLNSCWVFDGVDYSRRSVLSPALEGPYMSLRYEHSSGRVLVSSRPNQRHSYTRHVVCELRSDDCPPLVEMIGAPVQSKLTRSCLVSHESQTFVAAHHETDCNVTLWNVPTGQRVCTIPTTSPILDLAAVRIRNDTFLCSLNERKMNFYKLRKC